MKRSPLKRTGAPLRRTPLKQQSAKRRAERGTRADVAAAALARDRGCVAALTVPEIRCWGPLDPDEWDLRSARPGGHLDLDNVQTLCRGHHDWKHAEPIEAAHRGLRPYPAGYMGPRVER